MAKYLPPPKSLKEADKTFLKDVVELTESKFKGDLFGEVNRPLSEPSTTSDGKYHWATNKDFLVYVTDLTGTGDVRSANARLYQTLSQSPEYEAPTMSGAPEQVASSMPDKFLREQQQAVLAERAPSDAESQENAKAIVEEGLKKQREIYEQRIKAAEAARAKAEQETRYVKAQEKVVADAKLQEERKRFVETVNKNPIAAVDKVYDQLKEKVGESVPDQALKITAIYAVASAQEGIPPAAMETLTEDWIKENPQFNSWASPLADQSKSMHALAKEVAETALGPDQTLVPEYNIDVSTTPKPDYQPTSLGYIPIQSVMVAKRAETVAKGGGDARPDFMITDLERQLEIAHKGVQGSQRGFDGMIQGYFETYTTYYHPPVGGGATTTTDWSTKIDSSLGTSEVAGLVGNLAGGLAKQAATKLATSVATKAVGTQVGAEIGGALGAGTGPGAIITAAIGAAVGWLADHINPRTIKKWSLVALAVPAAIFGALFGIPVLTALGLLGAGVGTASALGLAAAGVGGGIVSVLGAIGSATLGAIGGPILVFLLGFPIVVALILFIINSGAYMVPPGGSFSGSEAVCDIEQFNGQPSQAATDPAVNAAMCILRNLGKNGINPLLASNANGSAWQSFVTDLAKPAASDVLHLSATSQGGLQCSGYVGAVASAAYGVNFPVTNACLYTSGPARGAGYRYVSGTGGIQVGDFFVIGSNTCSQCGIPNAPVGSCGHIGVVCELAGVKITACDANAKSLGLVRADGVFATSQITGYLRR